MEVPGDAGKKAKIVVLKFQFESNGLITESKGILMRMRTGLKPCVTKQNRAHASAKKN